MPKARDRRRDRASKARRAKRDTPPNVRRATRDTPPTVRRATRKRPPTVRRATGADLPHIGRLGALLVGTHHEFDSRRFLAPTGRTKDAYASYLGTQLDAPGAAVFVAEDEGEVIGYAYVAVESYDYMALRGPAGVLHDLIVDPEHRRGGVGRELLGAALEFVLMRGLTQIVLGTAQRNEAAQRFFASAGFRPTMIEMTRDL